MIGAPDVERTEIVKACVVAQCSAAFCAKYRLANRWIDDKPRATGVLSAEFLPQ